MLHGDIKRPTRRQTPGERSPGDGIQVTLEELLALRREARGLRLGSLSPVNSVLAGNHHSRFRGRGMDYQESRIYQPGDDIRSMDWRVTARAGRPHTKLYQEERERPVVLLVDLSPTMFFASRGALKSVVAARAAAFLGWAAVAHGDRIGALIFNGGHRELQPAGGDRGMLRLLRQLIEDSDPRRAMNRDPKPGGLNPALQRLRRVARPGSLIFVLSDFYGLDEETDDLLTPLCRHNELLACRILDRLEQAPPPPGRYAVSDGRHKGILDSRSDAVRHRYQDYFTQRHQALDSLLRRRAIPLLPLDTGADVGSSLRGYLQDRNGARRRRRRRVA